MAGIRGSSWSVDKFGDVAVALDDLTKQLMLTNKIRVATILNQQKQMDSDDYHDFLWDVYNSDY